MMGLMFADVLFDEYREDLIECRHFGMAALVDENGLAGCVGDSNMRCWYRSASKPIQALPLILRGIDKKYCLTDEEIAVICSSHKGDEEHIRAVSSILEKAGISEADMCMKPTYPQRRERQNELLRAGMPPRKLYHNCSGKHAGMMMLARDIGDNVSDYWRRGTGAQNEILAALEKMTDITAADIRVGTDGCGVPVYAVPLVDMAKSFLRLACPDLISDKSLAAAVSRVLSCIHAHPNMLSGAGTADSILSADPNLIVKYGAQGVICIGVSSLRLGAAVKVLDGSTEETAAAALRVLELIGYDSPQVQLLRDVFPNTIVNDNGIIAGRRESVFTFSR